MLPVIDLGAPRRVRFEPEVKENNEERIEKETADIQDRNGPGDGPCCGRSRGGTGN